jgi:hypothetical protein
MVAISRHSNTSKTEVHSGGDCDKGKHPYAKSSSRKFGLFRKLVWPGVVVLAFIAGRSITQDSSSCPSFSSAVADVAPHQVTTGNAVHPRVQEVQGQGKLNPFFSIKPLQHSLHPTWKLWTELSETEQKEAMIKAGAYLTKYGAMIQPKGQHHRSVKQGDCVFDATIGSTGHTLCGPAPVGPCTFISFGINDDPSWDREVADTWKCRGFAGDPTVHHPSKLHDLVTFHNIGASMLQDNEERNVDKGGSTDWWMTSMPKLRYFLGLEKIDLLKMDCEGCEVTLARDILREDPYFLHRVDQISIESHVTKAWMTTTEHVYYFAMMFALLEEAGFKMEWSSIFGCLKRHEIQGCLPEFEQYGWPCSYTEWPDHPKVVHGRSCQEFTWKRYDA